MAKTAEQLANRTLEKIGVLEQGGTPSTADQTAVTDAYAAIYQEAERLGWAFWDEDAIPEYVFEALGDFMAGRLASDFGFDPPPAFLTAEARLRLMASNPQTGEILSAEYF